MWKKWQNDIGIEESVVNKHHNEMMIKGKSDSLDVDNDV